ncbi:MAG TPA: amidohydrolase [Terriglobales bacterium]|nr:amidohydrolase [Terriglobales bacterium]
MSENQNRRGFLGTAAAALAATIGWPLKPYAQGNAEGDTGRPTDADLIVTNAKVYTVDAKLPRAEAFAIKNGRFVAVGTSSDISGLRGRNTQLIDAAQMTVTPGFIDCHNHAPGDTLLYDVIVGNPYEVEFVTIQSIIDKLRERAMKTPPGYWVVGEFFDDTKVKDKRELNINDLDQVSNQHPVEVHHRGGHTSFYNSKAFELAGVTRSAANPAGGTFDRDPNGELNGRVTDRANGAFRNAGKRPAYTPEQELQRNRDGLAYISKQFVRYGITSACHEGGDLNALQEVRERGELLHRVYYEPDAKIVETMIAAGLRTDFGDDWIRLGATAEHTLDGSFSERTMAISVPYRDITPPYQGNITTTQEDLNAWVERMHRAGIRPNCHANGDVAIAMMLTAYERALKLVPRADTRFKITHCTLINDDLVRRIKAIGAMPAMFNTYAYYNADKFHFYGEELMQRAMAFRSMLDAGVVATGGSDFPPGPFDPRMAIQGMVTRKGWNGQTWGANQRVTIDEAIRINTLNGAYDTREEHIKGSITPGKLADFVIFAEDPHTTDVEKIKDIKLVRTVVGGKTVYQA